LQAKELADKIKGSLLSRVSDLGEGVEERQIIGPFGDEIKEQDRGDETHTDEVKEQEEVEEEKGEEPTARFPLLLFLPLHSCPVPLWRLGRVEDRQDRHITGQRLLPALIVNED
jgi:hypothetical protein